MLKKALKLFLVLVLAWILSLLVIFREFKSRTLFLLNNLDDNNLYNFQTKYRTGNGSLSKFEANWPTLCSFPRHKLKNKIDSTSASELNLNVIQKKINLAWNMLDDFPLVLSFEDRLAELSAYNYPPGVNGTPVRIKDKLKGSIQALVDKGWQNHVFNEFVSDVISVNRSLPDVRDHRCKNVTFPKNLPLTSVIICFHNEAWSTLLRTIHSVIDRSPKDLLNEIILVDDFSTMKHLQSRLQLYVQTIPRVRLIRTSRREGLIRARVIGVKQAVSSTVVFLDSHCECAKGWLEPLLIRINSNPKTVVSPIIDLILDSTFEYVAQDIHDVRVGGFTWDLKFIWNGIPYAVEAQRTEETSPVVTPVISGGLFAIDKDFFKEIGYYDEGFQIWGGDNLELSFKIWMCGGSLEIVPCSHVGHVFRKRFPYKVLKTYIRRNLVRVAEVWMDDYAKYYYARINYQKGKFGNLTQRKELREKLKCKSFDWYLKNIYPELKIPSNLAASGQIKSISTNGWCLDAPNHMKKPTDDVKILKCHFQGGNQYWVYSHDGELRRDNMCLDYLLNTVTLFFCRRSDSQIWLYDSTTHYIRHLQTQKCLTVGKWSYGLPIILDHCESKLEQKWEIENFIFKRLTPKLQNQAKENSRSLLNVRIRT